MAAPVIDAHVHYWDPATTPREASLLVRALRRTPRLMHAIARRAVAKPLVEFVGDPRFALAPWLPRELNQAMGRAAPRVRGVVHIQAGWQERGTLGPVGETRWLESLSPRPLGIVAHAALDDPQLGRVLDGHAAASSRFAGVRDMLAHPEGGERSGIASWSAPGRMATPAWRKGYAELGARGLTFDAFVYAHQLDALAELAEAHPETPLVLDHLGTPPALGGPFAGQGTTPMERSRIASRWRAGLARLAALPHVHVKLSGMTMPILGYGFHRLRVPPTTQEIEERIGPHWADALSLFGPARCLFASNFPVDAVSVGWATRLAAFERVLAAWPEPDRRAVLHDNAARFYRLPDDVPSA